MEFYVMGNGAAVYGSAGPLGTVGDFLLAERRDFGSAIKEIGVELLLVPPHKGIADLLEQHERDRAKAPTITFRRQAGTVTITFASQIDTEVIFPRNNRGGGQVDPVELYAQGVDEVLTALELLDRRIKPSDDFDLAAFHAQTRAALERIPSTEAELGTLNQELEAAFRTRLATLDEWELLDIDWSLFHPDARTILDDPFLWDRAHDFAPHGNDTGADLLADYLESQPWRKGQTGPQYLASVFVDWGYQDSGDVDADLSHEAWIALAFAEIKVHAALSDEVRERALKAIEAQRNEAQEATEWAHRDECLATLDLIEQHLPRA